MNTINAANTTSTTTTKSASELTDIAADQNIVHQDVVGIEVVGEEELASNEVLIEDVQTNVVNIRMAKKAQEQAQKELFDYMMWTMKHDMDPHRLYDDPIEVFRAEMKAKMSKTNVA